MATEINACVQFLDKVLRFVTSLPTRWYKGSSDLKLFPIRVDCLRAKFTTYGSLLKSVRLQDAEMLNQLAMEGTRILEEEMKHSTRLQQNSLSGWKCRLFHRVFPGQLAVIVERMEDVLNAGIQLLQFNLDTPNLVERSSVSPLPFGQDSKYVPIKSSIGKVREVLTSEHECNVATLCGEPGLGKTSLVKYLALQYQPHHTSQGSGEVSSAAVFPDGVFFLPCGQGGKCRIKQLQRYLLQNLGCESEAVPADIPEQRDGDYVAIPTFRRRLQFKLRNLKALIILDDVWERGVLEELILSPDEAGSLKYLVTSQIVDIWPDAAKIIMERPTLEEARQILLKYTNGLSTKSDFPKDIGDIANSIIRYLGFHPLTLANLGLGFRQEESQEPGAWRTIREAWAHEPPIKDFYEPVIYGRGYPLALDESMTRVVGLLKQPERDLLFLMCTLHESGDIALGVPETAVKWFYKWAKIGNMSGYRCAINHLQNSSLVDVYNYSYMAIRVHKLRALSIISQFPCEVRDLVRRALQPARETYSRHSTQTAQIGTRDCQPADVNNGLLSVTVFGMYMNSIFLDDARREIPRDFDFDVENLLETAREKKSSLRDMVGLLQPDPNGEGWKQEAALCAKKIIVKFVCQHELDDKHVARLIQLPQTRSQALFWFRSILSTGYWLGPFFQENKTFSSSHGQIVENLSALVNDDATSTRTLHLLVDILFGWFWGSYGMLDYENDDTIVNIGERLIKLALGNNANISSKCMHFEKFPPSRSRAFCVIEKRLPDLWKTMLTLFIQEGICKWYSSLSAKSNAASKARNGTGVLGMLCRKVDLNFDEDFTSGWILVWVSFVEENREKFWGSPNLVASVVSLVVRVANQKEVWTESRVPEAVLILRNLGMSQEIRQKILYIYPQLEEALEGLVQKYSLDKYFTRGVSEVIGLFLAPAIHIKISDYNPPVSEKTFGAIVRGRIMGYYYREMYEEFLAITDGDLFPKKIRLKLLDEIIMVKVMLKQYESALVTADEKILHTEQQRDLAHPHWELARVLGLRGSVRLLSGNNLSEALADFKKAIDLLAQNKTSTIISYRWGKHCTHEYLKLIYQMLKQRGFTKHLLGDNVGAREDAMEAQQLQLQNLVRETSGYFDHFCPPPERLFSFSPLTYLGFNFTF